MGNEISVYSGTSARVCDYNDVPGAGGVSQRVLRLIEAGAQSACTIRCPTGSTSEGGFPGQSVHVWQSTYLCRTADTGGSLRSEAGSTSDARARKPIFEKIVEILNPFVYGPFMGFDIHL